ncbi:unnamed protein product [Amoebophrya sp. A25]|nr:unnamed protein product [Amoebophrya sp. A25]|eukprot:GSA25T00004219001.1
MAHASAVGVGVRRTDASDSGRRSLRFFVWRSSVLRLLALVLSTLHLWAWWGAHGLQGGPTLRREESGASDTVDGEATVSDHADIEVVKDGDSAPSEIVAKDGAEIAEERRSHGKHTRSSAGDGNPPSAHKQGSVGKEKGSSPGIGELRRFVFDDSLSSMVHVANGTTGNTSNASSTSSTSDHEEKEAAKVPLVVLAIEIVVVLVAVSVASSYYCEHRRAARAREIQAAMGKRVDEQEEIMSVDSRFM